MADSHANESSAPSHPIGRKLMRKVWGAVFSVGALLFVAGMVFWGGFGVALDKTNELEFCVSCHSMQINLEEYKETVHYKNRTGVRAVCSDCHVPKELGPKLWAKLMAYKDVMHEILGTIDTREKFEAHRWEMANRVWDKMRARDSHECRNCHKMDAWDFDVQGKSAKNKHQRLVEGASDKTCIDCHAGIAHTEPEEPDEPAPAGG